jgi:mRNA interferase HigB
VKIVDEGKLAAFGEKHPPAKSPLIRWQGITAGAKWKTPIEMKQTFGTADIVGSQTVFNIGGNKYRLIALINYIVQLVVVQEVLTHSEYDKGEWK